MRVRGNTSSCEAGGLREFNNAVKILSESAVCAQAHCHLLTSSLDSGSSSVGLFFGGGGGGGGGGGVVVFFVAVFLFFCCCCCCCCWCLCFLLSPFNFFQSIDLYAVQKSSSAMTGFSHRSDWTWSEWPAELYLGTTWLNPCSWFSYC